MTRIAGMPPNDSPDYRRLQDLCIETLGFVPNSVLMMLRVPGLAQALGALNGAVMGAGTVDKGFKRLIAHMASRAAGCQYCQAHTAAGSQLHGVSADKLDALWGFERSALFNEAERVALDLALAAGQVPNAVDDALFLRLRAYWSEEQILEIVGVISLFGFLNRWNDTLATPLEEHPVDVAKRHLASHGWTPGKHQT
ncbi:MAG: carboxymuconolactone decarboxylase family protein [Rhodoferax sp.]